MKLLNIIFFSGGSSPSDSDVLITSVFLLSADLDVSFSQTVPSRICPKKFVSSILFFTITDGEEWVAWVKDVKVERADMTKEVGAEVMREKVTGVKAAVVEGLDMADVVVVVKEAVVEGTIFFWAARIRRLWDARLPPLLFF